MPLKPKAGTRLKRKAKASPRKPRAANDSDLDGGGAPKGPPSGKAAKARPPADDNSSAAGVPAAVLTKAAALGARNAGPAPALGGAQAGAPVRFKGSPAASSIQEFSGGPARAESFDKNS